MNNVSHNKICHNVAVQTHAHSLLIPLTKSRFDLKTERDYVKIKLHRNYMSETLDIYEFKMDLFENGKP